MRCVSEASGTFFDYYLKRIIRFFIILIEIFLTRLAIANFPLRVTKPCEIVSAFLLFPIFFTNKVLCSFSASKMYYFSLPQNVFEV